MTTTTLIYNGTIKANYIGEFSRGSIDFTIIRPGFDIQGRKRISWTQFVVDGVPVFEVRKRSTLEGAMDKFDALWDQHIGQDTELLRKAITACQKERLSKFQDGVSGESPAPTTKGPEREYPA